MFLQLNCTQMQFTLERENEGKRGKQANARCKVKTAVYSCRKKGTTLCCSKVVGSFFSPSPSPRPTTMHIELIQREKSCRVREKKGLTTLATPKWSVMIGPLVPVVAGWKRVKCWRKISRQWCRSVCVCKHQFGTAAAWRGKKWAHCLPVYVECVYLAPNDDGSYPSLESPLSFSSFSFLSFVEDVIDWQTDRPTGRQTGCTESGLRSKLSGLFADPAAAAAAASAVRLLQSRKRPSLSQCSCSLSFSFFPFSGNEATRKWTRH